MSSPRAQQDRLRKETVGRLLREARQKLELSQSDVAKTLRYGSPQFVSNWERGRSLPPLNVLPKLTKLLKIKPSDIIEVFQEYQEGMMVLQASEIKALFRGRN